MDRGVRMVQELRQAAPGRSGIVREVGELLDIHPEALRHWVKRADGSSDSGLTAADTEVARVQRLEEEIADLRRTNGILKAAALLFAAELEPRRAG
jgi:transposase